MAIKHYNIRQITLDTLVSAGFITPGTIISCLISGASYGYALCWVLLLSVVIQACLQGQMIRLGIITQKNYFRNFMMNERIVLIRYLWITILAIALILSAILVEASNFSSFQLGVSCFFPTFRTRICLGIFALVLLVLITSELYQYLEKFFIIILSLISILFIYCCLQTDTDWSTVFVKLFPTIADTPDNWLCICSLIGTVLIPYSIYLTAGDSKFRWGTNLKAARLNSFVTLMISGLVSGAVLITAADILPHDTVITSTAGAISLVFQLFGGSYSQKIMGICLILSAFASALYVPVYAAVIVRKAFPHKHHYRMIVTALLTISIVGGGLTASCHWFTNPLGTILKLLTANTVLLPLVPVGLLLMMNRKILGEYKNTYWDNIITVIILFILLFVAYHAVLILI